MTKEEPRNGLKIHVTENCGRTAASQSHFEAVQAYLIDNGWAHNPMRNKEDHDTVLEVRTFLNALPTQNKSQLPHLAALGSLEEPSVKKRRVTFDVSTGLEPQGQRCSSPRPRAKPSNKRQPKVLTEEITTKVFPEGATDAPNTITVPWTNKPTAASWFGILTVVQHTVNDALLTHCAPWTWLHESTTPDSQPWHTTNIYTVLSLSAKLAMLQHHNTRLCANLDRTNTAQAAAAACAKESLSKPSPNKPAETSTTPADKPRSTQLPGLYDVYCMKHLQGAYSHLLKGLQTMARDAKEMMRQVRTAKTEFGQMMSNRCNNRTGTTRTSPALALEGKMPGLLVALEAVEDGVGGLVRSLATDVGRAFKATETAAGAMGGMLRARLLVGDKVGGAGLQVRLESLEKWFAKSGVKVAELVKGLSSGDGTHACVQMLVGGQTEEPWDLVEEVAAVLERDMETYQVLSNTMGGLMAKGEMMLEKVVRKETKEEGEDLCRYKCKIRHWC